MCFFCFPDGREFIPSQWTGTYTCSDNNITVSYIVNLTKSTVNFGISGDLIIEGIKLEVLGTFAFFQQILAMQHQYLVLETVIGNNLTNVEIDMHLESPTYMKGAVVFSNVDGFKTCMSEMRRVAGML